MTALRLDELNHASADEFTRVLGGVFENSPWVAKATCGRGPFADLQQLHAAMCEVVRRASAELQVALIRAHPDLVGRAALNGTLTNASKSEQASAGLDRLTGDEMEKFLRYNGEYHARFGFPFVICARLNKKDAILKGFEERLKNSRTEEMRTALEEIYKIAYLRLKDLVRCG